MKNSIENPYLIFILVTIASLIQTGVSFNARIVQQKGDVQYRQGVEETWETAKAGILLEDIDSIVTGEEGSAVLETDDGRKFNMGYTTMIDIADLRKISEQDFFLTLMKEKVNHLEKQEGKTPLRIGTVSVVHGAAQDTQQVTVAPDKFHNQELIINGIRALFQHEYYPNTILKIHQFFARFPSASDCGELYYYLGSSFQALNQSGQAMDAFRQALQSSRREGCTDRQWETLSRTRLKDLEKGLNEDYKD